MEDEVVELMSAVPPGVVADATIGGGGHAEALLRALPGVRVVGIDRDEVAVRAATDRLATFGGRAVVQHARFDRLVEVVGAVLGEDPTGRLSGVLFDLGVSSPQLDDPDRGFSYRFAAPLDMRMDREETRTAADVIDALDERALAALFVEHGEDRFARRIARAVVAGRPFASTTALADAVRDAVPAAARRRGNPAKRVFQALRVAVNRELDLLGPAVDDAVRLLVPGGRCVVLSYHSGEDRIVKQRFADGASGGCTCPPALPCVCGAVPTLRILTRGARLPSAGETEANPRAASARLRAAERLGSQAGEMQEGGRQ
jgi:16S rRNA (cytosine1402-N4)-methyltransferase